MTPHVVPGRPGHPVPPDLQPLEVRANAPSREARDRQSDQARPAGSDHADIRSQDLARARGKDRSLLGHVLRGTAPGMKRTVLVNHVTEIYRRHGVLEDAQHRILRETRSAVRMLGTIPPSEASAMLAWFAGALVHRAS